MKVTVWGARGSIPVSGPEYLRYGGDSTCLEIRDGSERIVVDAGTGIRAAGNRLHAERARRIHLLFTHAHWDHVLGFPFFRPLYDPEVRIEVHGCLGGGLPVREVLARTMSAPLFPVGLGQLEAELVFHDPCREIAPIGGIEVRAVPLSHPNGGQGYSFAAGGRRVVFLTDNELGAVHPGGRAAEDYARFTEGADLLLHDAEFTAEEYRTRHGWGHSVWEQALELGLGAGVRSLGLWHHNMGRSDAELDRLVAAAAGRASAAGADLEVFAARQGQELEP
jgi:phosphoribosyl 1,2-cyclic phosphodiesterase